MIEITTGRECGKCSLCCKLLHVVELQKPADKWCEHCRPGYGGCLIHETRPPICRGYFCGWMTDKTVGDEWYPRYCHMVLSRTILDGINAVSVSVEQHHPWKWREEPYYQQLKNMSYYGLHPKTAREIWLVQVRCNRRVWLMTPDGEHEITFGSYLVKMVANGHFDIEFFDTEKQAAERVAELTM